MLARLASFLWGKFQSKAEVRKFVTLGLIFFLIIGSYWALRPVKHSIFCALVGIEYEPLAKIISLFVIIPILIVYSKLVDLLPRRTVFYLFTFIYGSLSLFFAWRFMQPSCGLLTMETDPTRLIGWLWFIFVESFGSLMVSLFWAITTDVTNADSAKRGFPLIVVLGQTGNILGPLALQAKRYGFAHSGPIVAIVAMIMFAMGGLMWFFFYSTPKDQLQGYVAKKEMEGKKSRPGVFEGFFHIATKPYLLIIFGIVVAYEAIITVVDYHFMALARTVYTTEIDYNAYLNSYAIWTGIIATSCIILGISNIQRRLGISASLFLMPILTLAGVLTIAMYPTLTVAFWTIAIAKAVNYALNQPVIKQLYIPTSKDSRYKAQAWIDMFGSRGSKAVGSGANLVRGVLTTAYGPLGLTIFLFGFCGMSLFTVIGWLFGAHYLAGTYQEAIDNNEIVC